MKRVLVAGGSAKNQAALRDKLARVGLTADWEILQEGGKTPYRGIPEGCEAVIINIDAISHKDAENIFADCKAQGIPRVRCHDNWSRAEPLLRTQGILPPLTVTSDGVNAPHPSTIKAVAIQYILDVMDDSRLPSIEEVEAVIRTALGPSAVIPYQSRKEIYDMAIRQHASNHAGKTPTYTPTLAPVAAKSPAMLSPPELRELVGLEIEANLEFISDRTGLVSQIGSTFTYPLSAADEMVIRDEATQIRARWSLHHSSQTAEQRTGKINAIRNWMKRQIEESQANQGKGWPGTESVVKTLAKWGVPFSQASVAVLRTEILGPWAVSLFPIARVQASLPKDSGLNCSALNHLVAEGKIKGVKVDWKGNPQWNTSLIAVEEYLKNRDAPKAPAPAATVAPPAPNPSRTALNHLIDETLAAIPAPVSAAPIGLEIEIAHPLVAAPTGPSADVLALATMVTEDTMKGVKAELEPMRTSIEQLGTSLTAITPAFQAQVTKLETRMTGIENQLTAITASLAALTAAMPPRGTLAIAAALNSAGDYKIEMTKSGAAKTPGQR